MLIKRLELTNFRNYANRVFEFESGTTVIVGDNAVGKTNLLEAIFLLSVGESFKARRIEEMVTAIKEKMKTHPNSAIIHFPEGGTTGKRSNSGLYDLEDFKTGIFVLAAQLGVPVVPVAPVGPENPVVPVLCILYPFNN